MADYPAELARSYRLRDGRSVVIRPIRADDGPLAREFVDALSGESRYMRFQKWVNAPSDKLIHFLTDIDYDKHMAFVCIIRDGAHETLLGDARYVVNPDGASCEFGIMIADDWHHSGVAGLLMAALVRAARARGLTSMEGIVLSANSAMLRFARALGFQAQAAPEDLGTTRILKAL